MQFTGSGKDFFDKINKYFSVFAINFLGLGGGEKKTNAARPSNIYKLQYCAFLFLGLDILLGAVHTIET